MIFETMSLLIGFTTLGLGPKSPQSIPKQNLFADGHPTPTTPGPKRLLLFTFFFVHYPPGTKIFRAPASAARNVGKRIIEPYGFDDTIGDTRD